MMQSIEEKIQETYESLTEPKKQNIRDIRTLFPYLSFTERLEWCERVQEMLPELSFTEVAMLLRKEDSAS